MRASDTGLSKEQLIELCRKYMNEQFDRYDFIADSGSGMLLKDEAGNEYLDFLGGIAVNATGHCSERVVNAIKEQAETLIHASNYCYTVPQIMLAKLICENIGMEKIQFQNSGAEANEAAFKLVRKYGVDKYGFKDSAGLYTGPEGGIVPEPKRYKIISAMDSFHGRTLATLTATAQPGSAIQKGYEPFVPGFKYAEFNNLQSFRDAATEDVIAIIIEPVQGEGGVYPADKEFLRGLRDLCDKRDMLLIFDEVQTGWGRTGSLMAYQTYGVKPDIVTMAKALGGGMPIAAMATSERIMNTFGPGAHGTTFGGNPVCSAAAYAEITEMIDLKLPERAKEVGDHFRNRLRMLPGVKEVRGIGQISGVEFDRPIANEIKHKAGERFLLMTAVRPNVIRLVPPLTASREECDKAADIIESVLEELI